MATWRVHVTATDPVKAKEFREARENFKDAIAETGGKMTFEFSESNEKGAEALIARAKAAGFTADKEKYEDPLESSGATADFW
jgi:hypothetical protein